MCVRDPEIGDASLPHLGRRHGPADARHALTEPAGDMGPADIARVLCGAPAQVLGAAQLSIGRRIAGATRADVPRALGDDRTEPALTIGTVTVGPHA